MNPGALTKKEVPGTDRAPSFPRKHHLAASTGWAACGAGRFYGVPVQTFRDLLTAGELVCFRCLRLARRRR